MKYWQNLTAGSCLSHSIKSAIKCIKTNTTQLAWNLQQAQFAVRLLEIQTCSASRFQTNTKSRTRNSSFKKFIRFKTGNYDLNWNNIRRNNGNHFVRTIITTNVVSFVGTNQIPVSLACSGTRPNPIIMSRIYREAL